MAKISFKPGNMLYPLPAVLVSVADSKGNTNLITVAWAGTVCTNPPMLGISVRPNRFSHHMIEETGEFVVNLTTKELAFATDYCGVKSGRDINKWKEMKLTPVASDVVRPPCIAESPVNIECQVTEVKRLGSHDFSLQWWRQSMWMRLIWMKKARSIFRRQSRLFIATENILIWVKKLEHLDTVSKKDLTRRQKIIIVKSRKQEIICYKGVASKYPIGVFLVLFLFQEEHLFQSKTE